MMSFLSVPWIGAAFLTLRRSPWRKARFRPQLELLEGRLAPTTHIWTGRGGDSNWSTAGNWEGNQVPNSSDDILRFPLNTVQVVSNNDFPEWHPF